MSELAAAVPATPFAVFVAAFGFELARRAGRREVVLTSNVSNRVRREHENLLALLANNLPLRVRFEEGATFRDAVRAAGRVVLRTLDHQELPSAILIEEILAPAGPLPRFPSVQLAFPGQAGSLARRVNRLLSPLVEPVLRPFRNLLPTLRMGAVGLDLSPLILFVVIQVIQLSIC